MMTARVTNEMEVGVPADDVWAVYGSPDLPKLFVQLMPQVYKRNDVLEGDGTVGTVILIELDDALPEPRIWKEKFIKIDHQEREKLVRVIEGGFLDIGFRSFDIIFKVIEKDASSCIIQSTTAFELDDKFEDNANRITAGTLWWVAKAISNYVIQNKSKSKSNNN
uniref:Bet v I/Major latex protein domain-containing protein n=1 Tax=Nelumbo nucifera TaxID=4432 RepID=A0A822XDV1_NELNU|nr:TPA_asm: hypothetical protein HUJ06_019296 [Nelumbo nucifera]